MPVSFSYLLQEASVSALASATSDNPSDNPEEKRGILIPFRRDEKNDFANGTGIELIRSHVRQILGTHGGSDRGPGEIPWDTEFGSLVHTLRHQNGNPVLAQIARVYVIDALQ